MQNHSHLTASAVCISVMEHFKTRNQNSLLLLENLNLKEMLTVEKIKNDFSYIKALTGDTKCYQDSEEFPGHGKFCDIYFNSDRAEISQKQIDDYIDFKNKFESYIPEIMQYIQNNLSDSELSFQSKFSKVRFDVIEVPQNNLKYDLLLVCGLSYKKFILFNKEINMHVEIKNGKIVSIERKKYNRTI